MTRDQAHPLHVVLGGHDVGLHRIGGGFGRISGRHHAFIEGAGRTVAVVAAGAQEDGALLVHWEIAGVVARSGADSAVEGRQAALLRVAAAEIPLVAAAAVNHGGHEPPGIDGRIGRRSASRCIPRTRRLQSRPSIHGPGPSPVPQAVEVPK